VDTRKSKSKANTVKGSFGVVDFQDSRNNQWIKKRKKEKVLLQSPIEAKRRGGSLVPRTTGKTRGRDNGPLVALVGSKNSVTTSGRLARGRHSEEELSS